jgi:hypothetical protein
MIGTDSPWTGRAVTLIVYNGDKLVGIVHGENIGLMQPLPGRNEAKD